MNVHAIKIGNIINLSINGKLQKKICKDTKEADELFGRILKVQKDPSKENIAAIWEILNDRVRTALLAGLETDIETGNVYLEGFNTPVPNDLVDIIKEYHEKGYPLEPIFNFWKLLMINPDKRIRERLFDFIKTHDFALTTMGYMIVYKSVYFKDEDYRHRDSILEDFVSKQYLHVKKDWKCSPNKYVVYKDLSDETYAITKVKTVENWDEKERNIEILGKLGELFDVLFETDKPEKEMVYTDMHSRTMDIVVGKPVSITRKECDADFSNECSYGLHVGATKYVEHFGNNCSAILVCLVNPANVVAVPNYDHSKIRVSEYFPFATASFENRKIEIIDQPYFEMDYCTYEHNELTKLIEKVKNEEYPLDDAMNSDGENRKLEELTKIIENRLVSINHDINKLIE